MRLMQGEVVVRSLRIQMDMDVYYKNFLTIRSSIHIVITG